MADATFVQVREWRQRRARHHTTADGAGYYALVEPINNEWANNRFPNDPNGNVYQCFFPAARGGSELSGTDPAAAMAIQDLNGAKTVERCGYHPNNTDATHGPGRTKVKPPGGRTSPSFPLMEHPNVPGRREGDATPSTGVVDAVQLIGL